MRGRKLNYLRGCVFRKSYIKKESPNEGTETGYQEGETHYVRLTIKKESPNEGTETPSDPL